jgi:mono/diheme cytochrome c family protein
VIFNIKNTGAGVVAAALLAGVLGGCAGRLPEPNAADAMRAARRWPGTTVTDLHRGKQQYAQNCAGCHGLIDPRQFPSHRWPEFVKEMAGRSRMTSGDVNDLTRYLVVAAESPRTP